MNKILFFIFFISLYLFNFASITGGVVFSQYGGGVIFMNERSFSIPFQITNDNAIDRVQEVELLVSKDRGVRWYSVSRKPAESKFFLFEAESDGDYWFVFRMITASGSIKRSTTNTPQIRVRIDTTTNLNQINKSNSQNNIAKISRQQQTLNQQKQIAEGAIKPPKPTTFVNDAEKFLTKTENKKFTKKQNQQIDELTASDLPNKKLLIEADNENKIKTKPEIAKPEIIKPEITKPETVKTEVSGSNKKTDKLNKDERRAIILKRLFDDFAALFSAETDDAGDGGLDVKKNIVANVDIASGESDNTDKNSLANNRNENNNIVKNDAIESNLSIVSESSNIAQAVMASGSGAIAKNYNNPADNSERNTNQNKNKNNNKINDQNNAKDNAKNDAGINNEKSDNVDVCKVRITGVTMNIATEPYQIIVKWDCGDLAKAGKWADVLRSDSAAGTWQPVAIGLPNSGEYWWYVSPEDKKPFYLMIRTRNSVEVIGEDVTKSPITIQ
ncbi:MAG: hypothetical protein LBP59_16155 [Planctomycetaceae bacterium]|jgi:hypothetical protein|nr:hypothetical protein [Planctomycetaceae bacterium]